MSEHEREPVDFNAIKDAYIDEFAFDEEAQEKITLFRRLFYITAIALVLVLTIGGGVYLYHNHTPTAANTMHNIPVIAANLKEFKKTPPDPGGAKISNLDKDVYDQLIEHKQEVKKEEDTLGVVTEIQITPSYEEPLPIKNTKAKTLSDKEAEAIVTEFKKAEYAKQPAPAVVKAPPKEAKKSAASTTKEAVPESENAMIIAKAIKQFEQQDVKEKVVVLAQQKDNAIPQKIRSQRESKKVAEAIQETLRYRIQLGAYKSKQDASKAWNVLRKHNKEELKGLPSTIERADLGDKGIFFRLQAGAFTKESDARRVCTKLIEKNQGCFIVNN